MTTRLFVPFVVLCAMSFAAGCTAPVEMPDEKEKPEGWGLPLAPAPRAKKTTAELLVGTWRVVEEDGRVTQPGCTSRHTFTADGRLEYFSEQPEPAQPDKSWKQRWSGTYSVSGKTVRSRVVRENVNVLEVIEGVDTITEISESRLAYTGRGEYKGEFKYRNPIVAVNRYTLQREPAASR